MAKLEYKAKLLPDGHLSCPKSVVDKLKLRSGVHVQVIIDNLAENLEGKKITHKGKIVKLGGLWSSCKSDISDVDITKARKEMWQNLGEFDE